MRSSQVQLATHIYRCALRILRLRLGAKFRDQCVCVCGVAALLVETSVVGPRACEHRKPKRPGVPMPALADSSKRRFW